MDPSSTSAIGSKPDTTSGAQRLKFPPQTPLPNLQCCTASLWARSRVSKLQLAEMEPRPPLGALIPQNPGACQTTSRHSLWWPALYQPPQVGAFQLCCPFPSIILPQLWQFLSLFFFLRNVFISLILLCLKGGSWCSNGVIAVSLPGDLHDTAVSFVIFFPFPQKHSALHHNGSVWHLFHALISPYYQIHLGWIINSGCLASFPLPNQTGPSSQSPSCLHIPMQAVTQPRIVLYQHIGN